MQNSFQKIGKAVISLLLTVAILFSIAAVGMVSVFAATSTGVGLSAYCLTLTMSSGNMSGAVAPRVQLTARVLSIHITALAA